MRTIKAISLWQPWATGVAIGAKTYETRGWSISYRGELVIHAAKDPTNLPLLYHESLMMAAFTAAGIWHLEEIPLGAYIALVRLVDIFPTEAIRDYLTPLERAFGDYSDGRHAWRLDLIQRFDPPIPGRGYPGAFTIDAATVGLA